MVRKVCGFLSRRPVVGEYNRVMLKEIEIINFESHEHTVLKDLSPGLNLITGPSNVGKSAAIRALRLISYNWFDPASVRVGAPFCKVRVLTDKGEVCVTRGPKKNTWEITPNGQPTRTLDKVGSKNVPDAEAILGLRLVRLGDVDIPVNIMDQMESHFLLAGFGDGSASGSLRAQIVDEISGLSGVEGLIKEVGLDAHRIGREIKEAEDGMDALRKQLHDEVAIGNEERCLAQAEKSMKDAQDCSDVAKQFRETKREYGKLDCESKDLSDKLSKLPPDSVKEVADAVRVAVSKVDSAMSFLYGWDRAKEAVLLFEEELAQIGDCALAKTVAEVVVSSLEQLKKVKLAISSLYGLETSIVAKVAELSMVEKALQAQKAEEESLMREFKVCPLTLKPISESCLEVMP